MVTAILLADEPDAHIHLVESDGRKCAFLRAVSRETGLRTTIHHARIEHVVGDLSGIEAVSARALAPSTRNCAARTDAQGRAEFADLPKGGQATAEVVVDGETLTSDAFTVPSSGGLRVILVAGLGRVAEQRKADEARALAEPPAKGIVVLGSNSRILMEFQDDTLQVF